jgi:hypothetical protein
MANDTNAIALAIYNYILTNGGVYGSWVAIFGLCGLALTTEIDYAPISFPAQ